MIIICICLGIVTILGILMLKNAIEVKEIIKSDKLNNMVNEFPENIDICKSILKKLENNSVEVERDDENKTSLYIAISNKIIIGNINNTFTRVQTIAHECLHSIQNRKLLLFNFIYSNLYLLYFGIITIITLIGLIENAIVHIEILTILGFIYYAVRSFLEIDAMTKAEYLAKEYIEEQGLCSKEELNELTNKYKELNKIGIQLYNYELLLKVFIKILIYSVIAVCVM